MGEPATHLPQSSTDPSADDLAAQIEALLSGGELEAALAPKPSMKGAKAEKQADAAKGAAEGAVKASPAKAPEENDGDSLTQDELGSAIEQMLQSAVAKVDQIQAETDLMVEAAAAEALAAAKADAEAAAIAEATTTDGAAAGPMEALNIEAEASAAATASEAPESVSLEDELTALAEQLSADFKNQGETRNARQNPAENAAVPEQAAPAPTAQVAEVEAAKVEPAKVEPAKVEPAKVEAPPPAASIAASTPEPATRHVEAESSAAPVAVPAATAVPAVEHHSEPAAIAPAPIAPKKPRAPLGPIIRGIVVKSLSPIGSAAGAAGRALGKPLSMQKPMIRDSAGWIAVVTIFMAACMWAAVMLRDPKPYVPAIAPMTLVHEGGGGDGHGGGGGHGEKKAAAGGHGEKKADAGGHGEAKKADAGHGPAASPIVKREPLIQRGPPGAKKPAPKPASSGGH
jgi:hypothetical protein